RYGGFQYGREPRVRRRSRLHIRQITAARTGSPFGSFDLGRSSRFECAGRNAASVTRAATHPGSGPRAYTTKRSRTGAAVCTGTAARTRSYAATYACAGTATRSGTCARTRAEERELQTFSGAFALVSYTSAATCADARAATNRNGAF